MNGKTARIIAAALALLLAAGYFCCPVSEDVMSVGNGGHQKMVIPTEGEERFAWTPEIDASVAGLALSGKKKAAGMTVFARAEDPAGTPVAETAQAIDEMGDSDSVLLKGSFSRGTEYTLILRAEGDGTIRIKGEEDDDGVFHPAVTARGETVRRNGTLLFFAAGLLLLALTPLKAAGPARKSPGKEAGGSGRKLRPAASPDRRGASLAWATLLLLAALGLLICLAKPVFDTGNGWMSWDEDEVHRFMVEGMIPWGATSLADYLGRVVSWDPGYLPLALGGTLAGFFTRDSAVLYRACILMSSLCYAVLAALAVKHAPRFRVTFLVAATIPANLFQMTSRTYDTVVIGCILLGLALVLESCAREERVTPLRGMTMAAVMAFGTVAKPAYSLVLLSLFLIPADRFGGRKQAWLYRGFAGLMLCWCLAALVLPGAYDAVRGGDSRFPGANSGEQIAWIMEAPLERACIPFRHFWEAQDFLMNMGLAHWAYLGNRPEAGALYLALMLGVAPLCVWGEREEPRRLLTMGRRTLLAVIALGAEISLIFTQFIISTPVGEGWIQGMQARYFIPVWIALLLAVMMPEGIRRRVGPKAGGVLTWAAFAACALCNFHNAMFWLRSTGCL